MSPKKIQLVGAVSSYMRDTLLTPDAVDFVVHLHTLFNPRRLELLQERKVRQKDWDKGLRPHFLHSTKDIRDAYWKVIDAPKDLQDRRVEMTGPAEPKMLINGLNSGAKVFMADLEDACSPTWNNILTGLDALAKAVRRTLSFRSEDGKSYTLNASIATLMVRPRGWHLSEANLLVDAEPISASLFDFGLFFFHNAKELLQRGSGPYFYLPKMESHLEARLWNSVFEEAERYLNIPSSSIRTTALIETIPAAFEMEEILWELRSYMVGLNAGRWDYLFSMIKKFGRSPDSKFPDRRFLTMEVPFMRAYAQLLVQTCHRRGAHAIGGMAAFIPSRNDSERNAIAFAAVRKDKEREAQDGFDGTWVAHPGLVPLAQQVFDSVLGVRPHQKDVLRHDVHIRAEDLLGTDIPQSVISLDGLRTNIRVAIHYIAKWLSGYGAVAINSLMEDTATAEISRAQIWQWLHHGARTNDGPSVSVDLYRSIKEEELASLSQVESKAPLQEAANLLDGLVLAKDCPDFLGDFAYAELLKRTSV